MADSAFTQKGLSGYSGYSGYGTGTDRYIILTAASGSYTTTIGCTGPTKIEAGTNDIDYWALEFDSTTEERAFWNIVLPGDFQTDGSIYATFIWTNAGGGSAETVRWGIKGGSYANDVAIDTAYGTEVTVDDTWIAQGDVHISSESGAITLAGNPAAGKYAIINVGRKTTNDDLAGDARLLAVYLRYNSAE